MEAVAFALTGDPVLSDLNEPPSQSVKGLADRAGHFHLYRTGAPTATQVAAADRAEAEFGPLRAALDDGVGRAGGSDGGRRRGGRGLDASLGARLQLWVA